MKFISLFLFLGIFVACGNNRALRVSSPDPIVDRTTPVAPAATPTPTFVPAATPTPTFMPSPTPTPSPTATPIPPTPTPTPVPYVPNRTTAHGLGGNTVVSTFVAGNTVYAATIGGLSISLDGGVTFTNRTTAQGLASNYVYSVWANENNLYVGTHDGFSVSRDGGGTFTNFTQAQGLGDDWVGIVAGHGNELYLATVNNGLTRSSDAGQTFVNNLTGLGQVFLWGMAVASPRLYLATNEGLAISADDGRTFTKRSLGANVPVSVFAAGTQVYVGMSNGAGVWVTSNNGVSYLQLVPPGLGTSNVNHVFVEGSHIYLSTNGAGMFHSPDAGATWTRFTTAQGLGSDTVRSVNLSGGKVFISTANGLWISP